MLVYVCLVAFICIASARVYDVKEDSKEALKNMRHAQYCEILSSRNKLGWFHFFEFTAFNSFLYGCPIKKWDGVTESLVRKIDSSYIVKLNGPRHWAFDSVTTDSTLVDKTVTLINDIPMVVVGIVQVNIYEAFVALFFPHVRYYFEREVKRETTYIFRAGSPVYYLRSHLNETYAMQSYCTKLYPVNKDNLDQLGQMLRLPQDWSYHTVTLKKDFHLKAINAVGVIVNDNYLNVYSKFDYALLLEAAGYEAGTQLPITEIEESAFPGHAEL